jgi:hypothetical protein
MLRKLSTEALAMIGSLTVFTGSVYNTERIAYSNTKNVELTHELESKRMKVLQERELEISESKNKGLELEIKLETLKQSNLNQSKSSPVDITDQIKPILNPISSKSEFSSGEEFRAGNSEYGSNLNEVLLDMNKSSFFILDNSSLINFSTSIILNSVIGLSAVISLIINYYIEKYSNQYKEKAPKWSLPILNFYVNFTMYSNRYYIFILVLAQGLTLLIGIYLKFRNII